MPEPEASGQRKRTVREKTGGFLARNRGSKESGGKARDLRLAINAAAWSPWTSPYTNRWDNVNGPFYADSIQISEASTGIGPSSCGIFVVYKDGTADIIDNLTAARAKKTWFSVPAFVYRLVTDRVPAVSGDTSVRPRTAIGLSQNKHTFYVIVCDGDVSDWSGGADFTSLAAMMAQMGAYQAFNLDGGRSSIMVTWDFSANKPCIMGRPNKSWSTQRGNGANMGFYYAPTIAKLGTYSYDDVDFLMADIADNEYPNGITTVDLTGDVLFTATTPKVPTRWKVKGAAGASLAFDGGVDTVLDPGTSVTFEDVNFGSGSRTLKVPATATAVLNARNNLEEIVTSDASGLVIAGVQAHPLSINCATADGVGEVFATSTLPFADARNVATNLICATANDFVAVAYENGSGVEFKWSLIVEISKPTVKLLNTGNMVITVDFTDVAPGYESGYNLKLTNRSGGGNVLTNLTLAVNGTGSYRFKLPCFGFDNDYEVTFADNGGTAVNHTPCRRFHSDFGTTNNWFTADVVNELVLGGVWQEFSDTNRIFLASAPRKGKIRFFSRVTFTGIYGERVLANQLAAFATEGRYPLGAIVLSEKNDSSAYIWRALIKRDGTPEWTTLYGPAALDTVTDIATEIDFSSGVPRVRYSVGNTVLADADDNAWFDSAGSGTSAEGLVRMSGEGTVESIAGYNVVKPIEFGGTLFYLF